MITTSITLYAGQRIAHTVRDFSNIFVRFGGLRTRVNRVVSFLGINSGRSDDKKECAASVDTYIDRVVQKFDLNDTVVVKVPMDPGFTLTSEDFQDVTSGEMKSEYRSLIGSIGYRAITVRFDIASNTI